MLIAVASDHAGFKYKELLKKHLHDLGHEVKDYGTFSEDPVAYPDFMRPAVEAVARGDYDLGILIGGWGNGDAMAASRVKGVRGAYSFNDKPARLARMHNDANVISMGERLISAPMAIAIVNTWLETP